MVCTSIGAAQGWVAIGFGDDRAMGRDAVLMATASTLTSRWNEGMPKQSIKTEEIGVKNATVQGHNSVVSWVSQIVLKYQFVCVAVAVPWPARKGSNHKMWIGEP